MVKIGFSTTNMLLSRLIRWVTGAQVSHTWLLFEAEGEQVILQADIGGVQIDPASKYMNGAWTIVDVIDPKVPVSLAPGWKRLGEHYGYGGLIGSAVVFLGRKLKRAWKNPLGRKTSPDCSALVTMVLQESGYPGADKLDPMAVSPEDLLEFLKG